MPGIYPVFEMINERTVTVKNGEKIYGICWDYAAIFIAIARYYGLEVRMTARREYMSGMPGGYDGMGSEEYEKLKGKLNKRGVPFTYEQTRNAAQ